MIRHRLVTSLHAVACQSLIVIGSISCCKIDQYTDCHSPFQNISMEPLALHSHPARKIRFSNCEIYLLILLPTIWSWVRQPYVCSADAESQNATRKSCENSSHSISSFQLSRPGTGGMLFGCPSTLNLSTLIWVATQLSMHGPLMYNRASTTQLNSMEIVVLSIFNIPHRFSSQIYFSDLAQSLSNISGGCPFSAPVIGTGPAWGAWGAWAPAVGPVPGGPLPLPPPPPGAGPPEEGAGPPPPPPPATLLVV